MSWGPLLACCSKIVLLSLTYEHAVLCFLIFILLFKLQRKCTSNFLLHFDNLWVTRVEVRMCEGLHDESIFPSTHHIIFFHTVPPRAFVCVCVWELVSDRMSEWTRELTQACVYGCVYHSCWNVFKLTASQTVTPQNKWEIFTCCKYSSGLSQAI